MKYSLFLAACLAATTLPAQNLPTYTALADTYPHRDTTTQLNLHLHNPPSPTFWDSLTQYTNLQYLDLSSCQLKSFPQSICQLQNLQYLDLSYNYIPSIPQEINQLQQLRRLRFRKNQLQDLPNAITQLTQLAEADFTLNLLTTLPPNINRLQKLQRLNLSFNCLQELPPSLSQLRQAQYIDLKYNELQRRPDSLALLPNANAYILLGNPLTQERTATHQKNAASTLTHTDKRDSSQFASVLVNSQRWMTSDLQYAAYIDSSSHTQYLYPQTQLTNACPDGWHVATAQDWRSLFAVASIEFPHDPADRLNTEIATTRKDLFSSREDPFIAFDPYDHICGRWQCLSAIARPAYGPAHFPTQNFYLLDLDTPKGDQPVIYYWAPSTDAAVPSIIEFNNARQIREHCPQTPPVGRFRIRCVAD